MKKKTEKHPLKHYWHARCVGNLDKHVIHSHNSNIRVLLNGSLVIRELF